MEKDRLLAFSDGVVAIIITIMVLELKVPHGSSLEDLAGVLPTFLSYVLSFVYVAIYWNNHHHLLYTVNRVDGLILWANMHLLFWLSLTPFVMGWLGEAGLTPWPTAMYGVVLFMSGVAYYIMTRTLLRLHGPETRLARALGADFKGRVSVMLYAAAIVLAFWQPLAAVAIYAMVAIIWLVPDTRMERALRHPEGEPGGHTGD